MPACQHDRGVHRSWWSFHLCSRGRAVISTAKPMAAAVSRPPKESATSAGLLRIRGRGTGRGRARVRTRVTVRARAGYG